MECTGFDLGCYLSAFGSFWFDMVTWIPRHVVAGLLEGLLYVLEAIPAPSFLPALQANLAAFPPEILYMAQIYELKAGVSMILGAYVLRFGIRRLPFIG